MININTIFNSAHKLFSGLMIEYKPEEGSPTFLNADEQYILCIANCINTKLDKVREPLTTSIFTKFPEANIYKERIPSAKAKPGTLIIRGKIAIILGTMYPGSKEYNNDNREFRLKWFREGLIALQKLSPTSIAVRESFPEEFGGDWNKYLFHLNEMDKSIKISIYPYVTAVPIFNVVRFRNEDEHEEDLSKNNGPIAIGPIRPIKPLLKVEPGKGFGVLNLSKFLSGDDKMTSGKFSNDDGEEDEQTTTSVTTSVTASVTPAFVKPVLKLPPIMNKKILPIKIEAEEENPILATSTAVPTTASISTVPIVASTASSVKAQVEAQVGVKADTQTSKKYIANPDWIDLSNFTIQGWDEIMNDSIIKQSLQKANNFFISKELPQFGDFVSIFPPQHQIFNAFNLSSFKDIRVVILGQDCYINKGEAMGLAFSVEKGVKVPPSLRNIFKELATDIPGFKEPTHGNLMGWAKQGIFLLNSALTVREGKSGSHLEAWEAFTDQVISLISQKKENLVFILWGNPAKKKQNVIKNIDKHIIITAAHPSPLSATKGFFGSKCFSQTNEYLASKGLKEIDWSDL